MQLGMLGLGRMGANMVRRLMKNGHECVVFDQDAAVVKQLADEGAIGASDMDDFISKLAPPRPVWMMVPAAVVDSVIEDLSSRMSPGDWGLERGYCLMIGGEKDIVEHLDPIFSTIAPGMGDIDRTAGREGDPSAAERGYLHCGPNGAGHFVKMVHNGIEYGIMAAYAEGINILKHANVGSQQQVVDAETTPLRNPEEYQYDIDLADVAEVWRRGSVVASWLLDLTAIALSEDSQLSDFSGRVSDSGEGRWTSMAAIDTATPAPVLTAALFSRFSSRGEADFGDKLLSAMRFQFGGHHEKPDDKS